jgi:YggT family protein
MGMFISMLIFLLNIYSVILIVRSLLTWFPNVDRRNPLVQLLFDVTEPVLRPVRGMFPPQGGIDFSTMIVIIAISVITIVLQNL